MAISASSIASSSTLNELRTQFNNLVTDVTAIEGGSISYTTLNTTTTNATTLNVKEDGTIVFEGATDDGFETTLTVVDPTADRTITFPNTSGTVVVSGDGGFTVADGGTIGSTSTTDAMTISSAGIVTFKDDIIIKDGGTIGSASDVDAITIASNGNTTFSQNVIVTGDLTVSGDDITMGTNTASNLLIADGTNFNSVAVSSLSEISSVANDDVFLAIDTSGGGLKKIARSAVVSGLATSSAISNVVEDSTPQLGGDLDMNGQDIVTTSNADLELAPNGTGHVTVKGNTNSGAIQFNCENNSHGQQIKGAPHSESANNILTIPSTGGNSTIVSDASTSTLTNKTLTSPVINTGTVGTSLLPASADGATLGSAAAEFSDLFLADGGTIQLGNDQDVTITHIADTGVRMNSSSKIQFTDANESIHSDGTNLILTSGGTTFKVPTSDGSNGQALATNGSGTLSFINVSSAADDLTAGDAAINLTTTSGNITIDAQANDSDVIIKGTDATADITMATFDGSDAGTLILNHDLELGTDASLIKFGTDNEITLTHVADTGLLLQDSGGSPTLQFHNSSEAVSSDGSKLILTSNGVAFSLPTADGSNGQALVTNASGVLSFADAGSSVAFNNFEYTATAAQTSFSGNDDNSNSLAYTAGVNTVQVLVNGVMLDSSDYTATNGTAVVLSAAAAANDMIKVVAVQSTSVTSADLDGAEFVLDADGDTTIHADTDDQIDIKIAGADDFRFTANNFNVLSGSTLTIDSGATITNSGTSSGFGLSTGKAIVLSMIFG